jgi:hypothetical protein
LGDNVSRHVFLPCLPGSERAIRAPVSIDIAGNTAKATFPHGLQYFQ